MVTRRQLAALLAAPAVTAEAALAQAPSTPEEELRIAREQVRNNGQTLAKLQAPMTAEPAFQFKA